MKVFKNVSDFKMEVRAYNSVGAWIYAIGRIGGQWYSADSVFCGYSKNQVARILKNKMLKQANN